MALIKCPECGTEVSEFAEACPKCAFPMKKMEEIRLNSTEENNKTAEIEDNVENEEVDEEMKFIQSEEKQKLDRMTSILIASLTSVFIIGIFIYLFVNIKRPNEKYQHTHEDSVAVQKMVQQAFIEDSIRKDSLQKIRKEIEPYFRKKNDEFDGITWMIPKSAPVYANYNGIYLYFGINPDETLTPLRLRIQYAASDWVFFNEVQFLIDGENFSVYPLDVNREVAGVGVAEYMDEPTDLSSGMLNKLRHAKSAKMRFVGDSHHKDKVITQQQIKDIDRTMEFYVAYGGKH